VKKQLALGNLEVQRDWLGDAAKARERLCWRPEITLEALVTEMVDADVARLKRHEHL
jgi:GDPmannose 4,6-dehydratase